MASKRPPNKTEFMPSGIEVDFFDEIGVDGEPQQRRYAIDGTRTASVSTISKCIDPGVDGLMYWASNLTCDGIAELATQGGDQSWLNTGQSIRGALRDSELTWTDIRNRRATEGSNVHEKVFAALASRHKMPSLDDVSEDERGYAQAAMRWWADNDPKPILAEQMTASERYGFAGRFDLLATIDGETVLVDAKTRAKPKSRLSDHVQLAGYDIANREAGFKESDRQLVLILLPDGDYCEVEGQAMPDDFLAALAVYRRKSDLGKLMRKAEKVAVPA